MPLPMSKPPNIESRLYCSRSCSRSLTMLVCGCQINVNFAGTMILFARMPLEKPDLMPAIGVSHYILPRFADDIRI